MQTFLVSFEAIPPADENEIRGAYVNSWIVDDQLEVAIQRARAEVELLGWTIASPIEASVITRETQQPGGLEYYEQAQIDGEVWVFYNYDDQDDD